MNVVAINGYNSFIGKNYLKTFKAKYKIIHYKKDINNKKEFLKFVKRNKFTHFIYFAALSREKCDINKKLCKKTNYISVKSAIDIFNSLKNKPKLIFISSSHVYGASSHKLSEKSKLKPKSLYAKLKLKSENFIRKNYSNHTILRIFNVYGNNQPKGYFIPDMIDKIKKNFEINLNKSVRDYIHVNEVSRIINFIIKKKISGTLNVGTGRGVSLNFLINQISKKYKFKTFVKTSKIKDKIVADISLLKSYKYKFKYNEKYIDF